MTDLTGTRDATVWAKEFLKTVIENGIMIDEEYMVGWFANAIETGYDLGRAPREGGQNARREPFRWSVDPDGHNAWQNVLGEAMGYVSMCWDVTPEGEFDSTNAADALHKVEMFIQDVM